MNKCVNVHLLWQRHYCIKINLLGSLCCKLLTALMLSVLQSPDNQEGSDWRDEDEKLPGHENLTEKDIELFRHIQELALQVHRQNIQRLKRFGDSGKEGA